MDRNRLWIIGAVVAMVAVVALGVLLGVQPQLSAASAADAQRASIVADNATKQMALEKLKSDYAQLPELKSKLSALRASVPSSESLSQLIADVDALAASTHATIVTFTPSDAQPYTPPVTTPAAGSAPSSTPSASPSPSATPAPAPTATAPAAPQAPATVTNPQITPANFVAIPITIGIKGSYSTALAFVAGLQHGSRLFLVNSFASGGSDGNSSAPTTWTIGGYAYVLLDSPTASNTPTASK